MQTTLHPELTRFIRTLPKTETHLHIEGALPWKFLQQLDPVRFAKLPASYAPDYKFDSFAAFEEQLLGHAFTWYTSPERYHEAAKAIFAEHLAANVRYLEVSFASGVVEFIGLDGRAVLDAIVSASPPELELRVFMGIHHNGFTPKMLPVIEEAITWETLAGFDLHGTETLPVDPAALRIWEEARQRGKATVAHAGEFCGADFVAWCVDTLGAQKIRHGTRAVEDAGVVRMLAERAIPLDLCPISNHKLMPGITLAKHPIRQLFDAGCRVTLSTDDPLVFGNHLIDEYAALLEHVGFSRHEVRQIAANGLASALADPKQISTWEEEMGPHCSSH